MTKKYTKIRYKIFFILLSISLLTILCVGGTAVFSIKRMNKSTIEVMTNKFSSEMLRLVAQKYIDTIEKIITKNEQSINQLIESTDWEQERLSEGSINLNKRGRFNKDMKKTWTHMLSNNPNIYSSFIATNSGAFEFMSRDRQLNKKLNLNNYNPVERPWYKKAVSNPDSLVWSNVYVGQTSKKLMITCSKAIYDKDTNVVAVVGADLTINEMNKALIDKRADSSSYVFLIDNDGNLLISPELSPEDPRYDLIASTQIGQTLDTVDDSSFKQILSEMKKMDSGLRLWEQEGGVSKYVAFKTIPDREWTLGLVISKTDLEEEIRESVSQQMKIVLGFFILITIVIFLIIVLIGINASKNITSPIKKLNEGAQEIGTGNLDFNIDVKTGDELEHLADEFNAMSTDLKQYIEDLETTTKLKERMESELSIASRIQQDMLPLIFPPFPDRNDIELFASMKAAKQVGGDFYDFFLISPTKLCFVIADVSGKGIPASLFMVISKTLMKSEAQGNLSCAEVLERVNNSLNEGNDEMMFVTVLLCMLDLSTGELQFANGGHNPPLIMRKGGDVRYLELNKAKILGVFPERKYSNQTLQLDPGDTLYLYTDGVTEAMNPENEQFTEDRLLSSLKNLKGVSVEEVEAGVQKDVKEFVNGAEQSDDITMLVVRYTGKENS